MVDIGGMAEPLALDMFRLMCFQISVIGSLWFDVAEGQDMVEMAAKIPKVEDLLSHVHERTMRAVSASIGSIMILDQEKQIAGTAASPTSSSSTNKWGR